MASVCLPISSKARPRLKCPSAKVGACLTTEAKPAAASSSFPSRMAFMAEAKANCGTGFCARRKLDEVHGNARRKTTLQRREAWRTERRSSPKTEDVGVTFTTEFYTARQR